MTNKYTVLLHVVGRDAKRTAGVYDHISASVSGLPYDEITLPYWNCRYPTAEELASLLTIYIRWSFVAGTSDDNSDDEILVVPEGRPGLFWIVLPAPLLPNKVAFPEWCAANNLPSPPNDGNYYQHPHFDAFRSLHSLTLYGETWSINANVETAHLGSPCASWTISSLYTLACDAKQAQAETRYDDPDVLITDYEHPEPRYYRVVLERLDGTKWTGGRALPDVLIDSVSSSHSLVYKPQKTPTDAETLEKLLSVLDGRIVGAVLAYRGLAGIEGIDNPPALRIAQYVSDDATTWSLYDAKVIGAVPYTDQWLEHSGYGNHTFL